MNGPQLNYLTKSHRWASPYVRLVCLVRLVRLVCLVCLVRLVRLVRLLTGYFRLFFRKQTDKRQNSVCTMRNVNGFRNIACSVGDPDPDPALVMYNYQVIVSEKMFLTNFLKNCHDKDTMGKFLLYIM